jgi:hypothetical protein
LLKSAAPRRGSLEALKNYVGNLGTLKSTIEFVYRIVEDAERRSSGKR